MGRAQSLLVDLCESLWSSPHLVQHGGVYGSYLTGPKDLLSDRCVLSCPSMDLVTCLLDFRLNLTSNRSIVPRLAASLAACAQLSALGNSTFVVMAVVLDGKMVKCLTFSVCSFQLPVTECGPFKDWGSCLQLNLGNQSTSTGYLEIVMGKQELWYETVHCSF